jgi:5-methylcytosine-specific restriction endonuclease McrA
VMQRFERDNTLASERHCLLKPTEFPSLQYRQRFFKANPYLTQEKTLEREDLPNESYWTGYESRPGMADLRPLILERDEYICQLCGVRVSGHTAEVGHIRPVRRFKRPTDANVEWNLWTLCLDCHQEKTKSDQQRESRVRVRHEAHGCKEREFHSPFQVGEVPLERSGQERFPDGERAAPKRSGEM